MKRILSDLRRWWSAAVPAPVGPVPYEVVCSCGQTATGFRKAEHQVVRCARCGEELFVLPISRLPAVLPEGTKNGPPAPGPSLPARLHPWSLPLVAACLTLLALVAVYWFVARSWTSERPSPDPLPGPPTPAVAETLARHLDDARKRMALGHFRLALGELQEARMLCERQPDACPAPQRRRLAQLAGQADLMVDRLSESLEEVLRHAAEIQEKEWQADFRHRYRGKVVLFDMTVRPRGEGRFEAVFCLAVHDEPGRLELDDLDLLRRLDLKEPQRLLFGARLADIRRERGRGWVVRLEPGSGVLVTEPAVAIACFANPEEDGVRELLRRQAEWSARE